MSRFLRWRVDLMERSVEFLDLKSAKEPIPDWNSEQSTVDPYQSMQVHDYLQVSFFRTPSEVKNASKKTIELFQKYYPELLEKKFFVNVPFLMGWVYNAMKLLVAKETFKKLIMLSYGEELAKHMGSISIPTAYGGKGEPLDSAAASCVDAESKDDKEEILGIVPTKASLAADGPGEHASAQAIPGVTGGEDAVVEDATPTTVPAPAGATSTVVVPVSLVSEAK